MRRFGIVVLLALATMWPAAPQGERGKTLSEDVRAALASGRSARVIVQADEPALKTLGTRFVRGLPRRLTSAMSIDVSPQELRTLIENHRRYTQSTVAAHILDNWKSELPRFVKVMPTDYARALKDRQSTRTIVAAE